MGKAKWVARPSASGAMSENSEAAANGCLAVGCLVFVLAMKAIAVLGWVVIAVWTLRQLGLVP